MKSEKTIKPESKTARLFIKLAEKCGWKVNYLNDHKIYLHKLIEIKTQEIAYQAKVRLVCHACDSEIYVYDIRFISPFNILILSYKEDVYLNINSFRLRITTPKLEPYEQYAEPHYLHFESWELYELENILNDNKKLLNLIKAVAENWIGTTASVLTKHLY